MWYIVLGGAAAALLLMSGGVRRVANAFPPLGRPGAGRVTSRFGTTRKRGAHHALDLATPEGTPVYSPVAGTIHHITIGARDEEGYDLGIGAGNSVTVAGEGYLWTFMHLRDYPAWMRGQKINRGVPIGASGDTGHSTGPHVHIEVRDQKTGRIVDPELVYPSGFFR